MANLLITGHTGELNVTAEAVGALYAAMIGKDKYILDGFECDLVDSNTVHVSGGIVCMNGREVYLEKQGENITVTQGIQGQMRIDYILLRYQKDQNNVESVEFVYTEGTPTSIEASGSVGGALPPMTNLGSILDGVSTSDMVIAQVTWQNLIPSVQVVAKKLGSPVLSANYPVGYIYLSADPTSPAALVGGVWEQLTGDRYLRLGNAFNTGGNDTHTHSPGSLVTRISIATDKYLYYKYKGQDVANWVPNYWAGTLANIGDTNISYTAGTGAEIAGSTASTTITPLYQRVYAWRRIS